MCHAKDETKCSRMCIRLQHGKKIVDEPEMIACTKMCKRVKLVRIKSTAKDRVHVYVSPWVKIPCDYQAHVERCIVTI